MNPKRSDVIRLELSHPDHQMARKALDEVIKAYRQQHLKIHGTGDEDDFLTLSVEKVRGDLKQDEEELRKLKNRVGIISLDDAKKSFTDAIHDLKKRMDEAAVELTEKMALIDAMQGTLHPEKLPEGSDPAHITRLEDYKSLLSELQPLQARKGELKAKFMDEHPQVVALQARISALEKRKKSLEAEDPKLLDAGITPMANSSEKAGFDLFAESIKAAALRARIQVLGGQLTNVQQQAYSVDGAERDIKDYERKRDADEKKLLAFNKSVEQARFDSGSGFVSGIRTLQSPTPGARDTKVLMKAVGGALAGGLILGLLLTALNEFVLDQTIKRSSDVIKLMRLPLFLSIPEINSGFQNGKRSTRRKRIASGRTGNEGNSETEPVAVDESPEGLKPFLGALRDRTIMYLERMTHKPKLIAVTGCGAGAGVTTIAGGLAKALSETAEGRVLLVDMNSPTGTAHPFSNGKPMCALTDVLDHQKPTGSRLDENLFIATATEESERSLPLLPKRFTSLVPKIKASDYDYVIFDMPPVTYTTITPRLAGLMDIVLLVVESEKAPRHVAEQAASILRETKANVAAVLNRKRTYIPQWLHQES